MTSLLSTRTKTFSISISQSPEDIKFVVLDLSTPDAETTITSTWSMDSNLHGLSKNDKFTLSCWILGESNAFSVNIGKSETVHGLKQRIKKENEPELDSLSAISLDVWKLSSPIPSVEIDAKLGHVQSPGEISGCFKLDSLDEISEHFSSPLRKHLHIVVQLPPIPSLKRSRSSPVEENSRATKRVRVAQPIIERKWSVNGEIREIDKVGCYYLDPGTQDETQCCLDLVEASKFVLLWGSRASGKTTRLFWLQKELLARGYQPLYISFKRINYRHDASTFWQSLSKAIYNAASKINLDFPQNLSTPTSCQEDFLGNFTKGFWKQNVVLIIDEFSELYHTQFDIRDDFLRGLREIRNNNEAYAISSIIAAGTLGLVYLNPSTSKIAPFNIANHVKNPYFSLRETRKLFQMFALDNHITIDGTVVEDIWAKSNGHPAMVCICGRIIFENLLPLIDDSATLSYQIWQQYPTNKLYKDIAAYNTFGSMLDSLCRLEARDPMTLLRSRFVGFLEDVILEKPTEVDAANFLTSEGVLLKPDPAESCYHTASPLVDGLIRNKVIPRLFPDSPSSTPPLQDEGEGLHVLNTLIESLKFFDKTFVHLAAQNSYKKPKVKIPSVFGGQVPRASVYDTELLRILSNWLRNRYDWTVTGQWHLQNDMKGHRYSDIVIKKEGNPSIVLKLLATEDTGSVKSHIQGTPKHMALLSATEAWVVHFTCEQDYNPVWQSDVELSAGVNVVHFAHDLEFDKVVMSMRWKDRAGNVHQEDQQLLII